MFEFCSLWNKKASNQEILSVTGLQNNLALLFVIPMGLAVQSQVVSSWGWWFFNSVDGVLRSHLRFFFLANLLLRPYCWIAVLSWFMKQSHGTCFGDGSCYRNIQDQMPAWVFFQKNRLKTVRGKWCAFDVHLVWDMYMYIHPPETNMETPKIADLQMFLLFL